MVSNFLKYVFPIVLLIYPSCSYSNFDLRIDTDLAKPYPFTDGEISLYYKSNKDSTGIPIINKSSSIYYHPVYIGRIALESYAHFYASGEEDSKEIFLNLANWFVNNLESNSECGGWYFLDEMVSEYYNLPRSWLSAMSQGYGLSILAEAYSITGDPRFLEGTEQVLDSFNISIDEGGVSTYWDPDYWYEEYASTPHSHVLNGFIFSLAGLQDFYRQTKSPKARKLFNRGVKSLKNHIHDFDAKFYSYYSQLGENNHPVAKWNYHHIHIRQLLWLYKVTDEKVFYNYAHRFLQYDFNRLYKKYENVSADYTMGDPDKYGIKNIIDKNWSWGANWNSDKFPVHIEFQFKRMISNLQAFILVLNGNQILLDDEVIVEVLIDGNWSTLPAQNVYQKSHKTGKYNSMINVFEIDKSLQNIDFVRLTISKTSNEIVQIREINFLYEMYDELNHLSQKINY